MQKLSWLFDVVQLHVQDNIHIYTEYAIYFNEGNILEAEEELRNMKYKLKKNQGWPLIIFKNIISM